MSIITDPKHSELPDLEQILLSLYGVYCSVGANHATRHKVSALSYSLVYCCMNIEDQCWQPKKLANSNTVMWGINRVGN